MKYQRPHVHIFGDNSIFEVGILLPLEFTYDDIGITTNVLESGVEIFITLGNELEPNVHTERIGPSQFAYSSMPTLTVEVMDGKGNTLGRFYSDDPQRDADPVPTDDLSHYIYLNQPVGGDYQLHVLVDIGEDFRNKDTSLGLSNPSDGEYTIIVEQEPESRGGNPVEGSTTFGSAPTIIVINSEDVSNSRVRGPKKYKRDNRDVRP